MTHNESSTCCSIQDTDPCLTASQGPGHGLYQQIDRPPCIPTSHTSCRKPATASKSSSLRPRDVMAGVPVKAPQTTPPQRHPELPHARTQARQRPRASKRQGLQPLLLPAIKAFWTPDVDVCPADQYLPSIPRTYTAIGLTATTRCGENSSLRSTVDACAKTVN